MDRIEFALIYFPFDPKNTQSPKENKQPPPPAPGTSFVAEKGSADGWSKIKVTLTNVYMFKAVDQPGWRNNGTGFTAMTNGTDKVGIRIDIAAKGAVSYYDYAMSVTVKDGSGKLLFAKSEKIPKDGGSKWYTLTWDPAGVSGQLTIAASISGGNPESFTYFVSGGITSAAK